MENRYQWYSVVSVRTLPTKELLALEEAALSLRDRTSHVRDDKHPKWAATTRVLEIIEAEWVRRFNLIVGD